MTAPTVSKWATGWESRGFAIPAAAVPTVCAELRTSARNRVTPAGMPTADMPRSQLFPLISLIGFPAGYTDSELAPLLCAGIIGYRSLMRAQLPPGKLGLYGFGGSAHHGAGGVGPGRRGSCDDTRRRCPRTRVGPRAASAQGAADPPPVKLDAAILFAPVGDLVPPALEALDRGGTLAIAGIHLSDIPPLNYQRHLFQERQIRSVTSTPAPTRGSSLSSPAGTASR